MRERAVLGYPLLASAVHDLGVGVAEKLEDPEGVGGPPVVLVAVEDHGGVVADAPLGEQLLEALPVDIIADHAVLQVGVPVELDGSGYMALLI